MGYTSDQLRTELENVLTSIPNIDVGKSCKKRSYKIGKKSVAFLGEGKGGVNELMLKLSDSLSQAETLAEAHPECFKVGKGGYVTVRFEPHTPDFSILSAWIAESHQMVI